MFSLYRYKTCLSMFAYHTLSISVSFRLIYSPNKKNRFFNQSESTQIKSNLNETAGGHTQRQHWPWSKQGPDSIQRFRLTSIGNPIVEIRRSWDRLRRSWDRLISTMGFPILVRRHLHIESGPMLWLGLITVKGYDHNSTLLALCERNPSVASGFTSQRATNAECIHAETSPWKSNICFKDEVKKYVMLV